MSPENERFAKKFGNEVYQARTYLELTQQDVADLVGITPRWYQEIETGTVTPSMRVGCRLIVALGIDASVLLRR